MSSRKRNRTIFLKRADFEESRSNVSLEHYIRDALDNLEGNLPDFEKSFFAKMHCSDMQLLPNEGILFYFTQTFEGSETSTVNKQTPQNRSVTTLPAPLGQDFLEKDISIFVLKNSVLTCSNGISTSALVSYFLQLFQRAAMSKEVGFFGFSNVAHNDNIRLINSVGVKDIDLDVQTYLATYENIKGDNFFQMLEILFGKSNDEIIRNKENMRVRLKINAKRGLSKFSKQELQKPLKHLAQLTVDDHADTYKITLKNGAQLSPTDLSVNEKIILPALGNSVDHKQVWMELRRVFKKYQDDQSII
ncbi:hypothetical protein [Terasakiella pusilla]|jgi:hypothetical protein|uniref:hypothetical protein n=1 Tax=Terasakiella pusilla TaxID=64973 RepID=UPI003AA8ADAA